MKERDILGRVIIASLIGGATYLGAGALEANSNQSQNQDKPNNATSTKEPFCPIPQTEKGQYTKYPEQVFEMSQQDCKETEECEVYPWATIDGSKGTPTLHRTTTIYDSQKGMCHITAETLYGVDDKVK